MTEKDDARNIPAFLQQLANICDAIDEIFARMLYIRFECVKKSLLGATRAMMVLRVCIVLIASASVSMAADAKNETLAERGKRMCGEAGVPLEDCTILPPALRHSAPVARAAAVTPAPRPVDLPDARASGFGTGKYGWCEDCTSLLAAAPVTPWSAFGGRQYETDSIEREGFSVSQADDPSDPGASSPGDDPGNDVSNSSDDAGDNDDGGGGDPGDNGGDDSAGGDPGDNGGNQGDRGGDNGNNGGGYCE
ncbi:MAG: hypothetical protein R3F54_11195 [Alphaproteobacteria bacterium]